MNQYNPYMNGGYDPAAGGMGPQQYPAVPPGPQQYSLAGNSVVQQPPSMAQYGYGNRPGQGGGYYEQQTPAGSFAAANQQYSQGANPAQQQYSQAYAADNPYIGQKSQGVGMQGSVMPWAQNSAALGEKANPYLGGTSQQSAQVGENKFGANNPYLQQSIDAASADARKNFDMSVRPALDSAKRASGSFGNTAIGEQETNAYSDLGRNLGNIANSARMQDYTQQQGLSENSLNRQQANNQFNSGLGAGDLNRNMAGFMSGQQIGMQGYGQALGAAQFDASLGNNTGQFNSTLGYNDLSRSANMAQGQGQFNAGQRGGSSQFNAGQGNQMGQFNASLGQNNNQFNAGQGNGMNMFNAGQGNAMLSQQRNLNQQDNQFNKSLDWQKDSFGQNMDRNVYNDNMGWMDKGQQNQINFVDKMMGWQNQGVGAANAQQAQPIKDWAEFSRVAQGLGGLGNITQEQFDADPVLGMIAGYLAANKKP